MLNEYDNRTLPVYTSELITRINTAHHQEMTQVNAIRKRYIDHLENEINLRKKDQNDLTNDIRAKQLDLICAQTAYDTALNNRVDQAELVKIYSHYRCVETSVTAERRNYDNRMTHLQAEILNLQNQLQPIELVSAASNQRHFFLTNEDHNFGYDPYRDRFEMIVKNN